MNVPVKLTKDWSPQWPVAHTPSDVMLQMHNGYVLWPAFVADVTSIAAAHGNGWWSADEFGEFCAELKTDYPNMLHITDLLRASCHIAPLHSQLVWHLGWIWQSMALRMLKDEKLTLDTFSIRFVRPDELMNTASDMDVQLVHYMEASLAASKNLLCFGMSTDKASICGLGGGVQCSQFSIPGNVIIYAAPQAPLLFVLFVVMVLLTYLSSQ